MRSASVETTPGFAFSPAAVAGGGFIMNIPVELLVSICSGIA
jgi:hypothetical protein